MEKTDTGFERTMEEVLSVRGPGQKFLYPPGPRVTEISDMNVGDAQDGDGSGKVQDEDAPHTISKSASVLFTILSDGAYEIQSLIIPHLYHRDLFNLRRTCKNLYGNLRPYYPSLLRVCEATYPIQTHSLPLGPLTIVQQQSFRYHVGGAVCSSGTNWYGVVKNCNGYQHPAYPYPPPHPQGLQICAPCHTLGLRLPQAIVRGTPGDIASPACILGVLNPKIPDVRRPTALNPEYTLIALAGSLVSICSVCFVHLCANGKATLSKDPSEERWICGCAKQHEDRVREHWYCLYCTRRFWILDFLLPIQRRVKELHRLTALIGLRAWNLPCGMCERFRDVDGELIAPGRWLMCVKCGEGCRADVNGGNPSVMRVYGPSWMR